MSYDSSLNRNTVILKLKGHQIIGELRLEYKFTLWGVKIERSPDHWWVTTMAIKPAIRYWNWKVTRSLVSYDVRVLHRNYLVLDWKVTRSLVSYDWSFTFSSISKTKLKGHQIIGELRLSLITLTDFFSHWKVTRSLVSYDEKKRAHYKICHDWKVTRSLVSYDRQSSVLT